MAIEAKFGYMEGVGIFTVYRILLTLWMTIQCEVMRRISDFGQLCISKIAGRKVKQTKIWTSEVSS